MIVVATINLQTLHCELCNASFNMIGVGPGAIHIFACTHTDHGLTACGETTGERRLSLSIKLPPSIDILEAMRAIK